LSTERAPDAWLRDIVTACQRIETYVARGRVAYDADPAILDALVFQLITIGEAAKALQQASFDERFPELPWSAMARTRDRIAHHYFRLDREIVWDTVTKDIPALAPGAIAALSSLGTRPPPSRP
jgi:uncharacterized protein with HEPN domain